MQWTGRRSGGAREGSEAEDSDALGGSGRWDDAGDEALTRFTRDWDGRVSTGAGECAKGWDSTRMGLRMG